MHSRVHVYNINRIVSSIQIQKTPRMKTSLDLGRLSIGQPTLREFYTDVAFITLYVGFFCLSESAVVLQSPFWQPHINDFVTLCRTIDPAKCASAVTMKEASCCFFHTFPFQKRRKNLKENIFSILIEALLKRNLENCPRKH